jgi:ATP-dependent helicase/DNAse subunit B
LQFSHSRLDCFESCKFKYKMRYIDKIEALPSTDANNALIIGIAMHTGIEKGVEEAIKTYYSSFPIITDDHVNEAIKCFNSL